MELRQLRYFIAVAEHLSFSKAAQQLHVTVPPLSRQIRQLEEEFEVRLFVRDRRHVVLTDAGRLLLQEAKALVAQTARVSDSVRMAKCGSVGLVKIGIGPGLGERVSRVLIEHSKRFPAVELQCRDVFSKAQYKALSEGEVDIGFLRPFGDSGQLASEFLFEEKLAVHISKSNPLSKRKSLRLKDLAEEPLLLFDPVLATGLHDKTLEMYAAAGVTPNIIYVPPEPAPHNGVQAMLLACRKGILIIPDEIACRPAPGSEVAVVPLDEPGATADVHVLWRKNENSRAVCAVLDTVRCLFHTATRTALPLGDRSAYLT
jgi:DNA-binding transcriptional LysR family regulator